MKTRITGIMLLLALLTIKANSQLSITSVTVTNATTCSVCNGSAVANVSGGFLPYTYYWSNLGGFSYLDKDSLLCPGTYTVYVYDSRGDSGSGASIFTIGPPTIVLSVNSTNTNCSGNTGTANANVSGGTSPYTYSWSSGAGTTAAITGLSAGAYTVSVTDANGCLQTDAVTVSTTGLSITLTTTNVLCYGTNSGSISVSGISGGVSPYTYSWSRGLGTNSSITGISGGAYNVTVTDNNGCSGFAVDSIFGPPPIVSTATVTGTTCTGNNGTARVRTIGGTGPYTYSWFPSGGTSANASGLAAGTYTLSITDHNGCVSADTVTIPTSGPITAITIGNDSCNGGNNGFATVSSVSGGIAPYTYSWSPSGNTTNSIGGLAAGTFTVTVSDNTGCTGSSAVIITQPAALTFVADTIPDTGSCTGTAILYGSGGTGPYTFSWSLVVNIVYDSGMEYVDSLCYGSYYVCVTDAHGCSACDSVHIRHDARVTAIGSIKDNSGIVKIYPDPVSDRLYITTDAIASGKYSLYIYDMIGRQVISQDNTLINRGATIPINVSGLTPGKYMLRISGNELNKMAPFMVIH
jgi:hypothetical protein